MKKRAYSALLIFFFLGLLTLIIYTFSVDNHKLVALGTTQTSAHGNAIPKEFNTGLEAHGGLASWQNAKSFQFELVEDGVSETHLIDLASRKSLIKGDSFSLGFDGKNVWIHPSRKAFKGRSPTFYHNLMFYFVAMPFVLADPGVKQTVNDSVQINGVTYNAIACTFEAGVGDADKDAYKLCFDPVTKRLVYLLYTVTYFKKEPSENFNLLHFESYATFEGGLIFPTRLHWYEYNEGSIGKSRGFVTIENLKVSTTVPVDSLFQVPLNAELDTDQYNSITLQII